MEFRYRYTRHYVARGARADAERGKEMILIKRATRLRATYQIRLLSYCAYRDGKRLIIEVSRHCTIEQDLRQLVRAWPKHIAIRRWQ